MSNQQALSPSYRDRVDRIYRIETSGKLSDGRVITSYISDPKGMTYRDYLEIDFQNFRAFGLSARTVGIMEGTQHDVSYRKRS